MPSVWKVTRSRLSVFQPDRGGRKPLQGLLSLIWALFWAFLALWILVGGAEAQQAVAESARAFSGLVRDLLSTLAGLLR